MRDGKEYGQPYKSNGKDTFESGDKVQLNVYSLEPGFIYIFHEGTAEPSGGAGFRLLYPKQTISNGSASIGGNQSVETEWITFSGPQGAENLWIVWSSQSVTELDSIKTEAFQHGLSDQNVATVKEFLNTIKDRVDVSTRRNTKEQDVTVRANGDLVPVLVRVEHH
jgi:hypothetical protein